MPSESIKQYDLVVIGGGPAGLVGANTAAAAGRKVALIDSHRELGGAGINTGTVPSKTLRETALALSGLQSRDLYGVDLSLRREATVADFLTHERNVRTGFNMLVSNRLAAQHVDVYHATAVFEDAHTIAIQQALADGPQPADSGAGESIRGEHILIATGSRPVRPAIFPFDRPEVYDSDTILELDRLPKTLGIVGAGTIGTEYACTFAVLGAKVHLIDGRNQLLPFVDSEVSQALHAAMEREGIVFHWNEVVQACTAVAEQVTLHLASGEQMSFDALLVAAGRSSNTGDLNLAAAGVPVGERGLLKVDEHYRTAALHIYAAGDVIGFPALASTSAQQARIAVRHAFGLGSPSHASTLLPTGVYTIPEIGMIGETEDSLRAKGVEYYAGRGSYDANARGRIIGDSTGFLKLLFARDTMELLGVHAIGEQATELVHIGMMAMIGHFKAQVFDDACFNVPTLGGLYKLAALDALQQETQVRENAEPVEKIA